MVDISIRDARKDEIDWINEVYRKYDCPESDINSETIAIAELNGERVGLGRLIHINDEHAEFGGMVVFEEHRRQGIGRQIVEYLVKLMVNYEYTWCFYLLYMEKLYLNYFRFRTPDDPIPERVAKKFEYCKEHYKVQGINLLVRKRSEQK